MLNQATERAAKWYLYGELMEGGDVYFSLEYGVPNHNGIYAVIDNPSDELKKLKNEVVAFRTYTWDKQGHWSFIRFSAKNLKCQHLAEELRPHLRGYAQIC